MAALLLNSAAMLEAHFGVPRRGVPVAVNNRLFCAEIGYILGHSGASYLLLDSELEPLTKPLELAGVTVIRCGGAEDLYEDLLAGASPEQAGKLAGARGGDDLD